MSNIACAVAHDAYGIAKSHLAGENSPGGARRQPDCRSRRTGGALAFRSPRHIERQCEQPIFQDSVHATGGSIEKHDDARCLSIRSFRNSLAAPNCERLDVQHGIYANKRGVGRGSYRRIASSSLESDRDFSGNSSCAISLNIRDFYSDTPKISGQSIACSQVDTSRSQTGSRTLIQACRCGRIGKASIPILEICAPHIQLPPAEVA